MKIIHLLTHTWRANGNVCAAVDLACAQADAGHTVYVCSSGGHFDAVLARHGVRHVKIAHGARSPRVAIELLALVRLIRAFKPDIVHAHMIASTLVGALLRTFLGFKFVTTVHNEFQQLAIVMGAADRVIGVSDFVTQSMIRRGIPARRIRTVLNGTISSPRFPDPPTQAAVLSRPAILYVGGLHPRKGVDNLIKAFGTICRRFPEAHLHLVGSGPHQAEYEALARDVAPAGRVIFCGHSDDPRPYMRGADIFVLASRSEPASLVLSEAREAGCAVIATEVGGNKEMLEDGAAGILLPPDRPDLLASALSDLLGDPSRLTEAKARSQINIDKMSLRRVAAETEQVYREILGDARVHRDARARARTVMDAQ